MSKTMAPVEAGTRESLMDAAESLFSERGIQAASLRAITERAGANLAAVHYHFGSKQGLVRAVFSRRLAPLNAERLRRLALCEAPGGSAGNMGSVGSVEGVLHAFLAPVLEMAREASHGAFGRLMGRAFMEPDEEIREILIEQFSEVFNRFTGALARLLPELPEREILWRFHFVAGALGHTVACGPLIERLSEGRCSMSGTEGAADHLVTFLAAGLRAPAPLT
ncbi:MAG TPA: TetR/AcrR family transcriptional regulator [Thermoanaerobaculia bacterium]|nr:TetR/AcrR family transcriptional regulator [Thermoanaerobaculia bacterium]